MNARHDPTLAESGAAMSTGFLIHGGWLMRGRMLVLGLALGVLLCSPSGATASVESEAEPARAEPGSPYGFEQVLSALRDGSESDGARAAAAAWLVQRAESAEARDVLAAVLAQPLPGAGGAAHVLRAVAAQPDVSPRLFPVIAARLASSEPEDVPLVLGALGSFHTRDSAKLLGLYVREQSEPAASQVAVRAMARLSGRDDLGEDPAAWRRWLEGLEEVSESQWRMDLIAAMARRADRLEKERVAAMERLVSYLRRLHLATRPEDRPALLAALLLDDVGAVVDLGFELVARELSATGRLDGPVGDASLRLLSSEDPHVRANAAVLVRQLAPEGAGAAVAVALAEETNPVAAADMLLAAARGPTRAVVTPAMTWLASGTTARAAAMEACWWLFRSGELEWEETQRVLTVVRDLPREELTGASVWLLGMAGGDADLMGLTPLLEAGAAPARQAAGEVLAMYPEFQGPLLRAAGDHPDLFEAAARGALLHHATAKGLREVLALPTGMSETGRHAVLRLARALPAADLLEVSRGTQDGGLRRVFLTLLTLEDRVMSERADAAQMAAISLGVEVLAGMQLDENQPGAVLETLDALAGAEGLPNAAALNDLRCSALLVLGRIEAAGQTGAAVEAWLRGLTQSRGSANARAVLAALEERFGALLTPKQREVMDQVRTDMAAVNGTSGEAVPAEQPQPR